MKSLKTTLLYTRPYRETILFAAPVVMVAVLFIIGYTLEGSQQFSELAQAFVHGKLNFLQPIGGVGQDPVLYHGKVYWDDGPFPAILLMPFVALFNAFHLFFYQGYIKSSLFLGILYFVYKLARILSYSKEDSSILTFGFALGSVFIGVVSVSSSWLFAQVVTTFLLFWGLYEFYTLKRWWLLGILCALILITRVTAAPLVLFFALEAWQSIRKRNPKIKAFVQLSLPLGAAVLLLCVYNYLRFQSPFNSGIQYQLLGQNSAEARSLGIFSLVHIPSNLFSLLLRSPLPVLRDTTSWTLKFPYLESNPYGISIFFTSPYLLYFFITKWSSFDRRMKNLLITILASALLVLSYYGIGMDQYGYRYSLDFLPELFLLFMILYRKRHTFLSRGMKLLLLGSGIMNFYLVWSFIF